MIKSIAVLFALIATASAEHFHVTDNSTGNACIVLDGNFNFNLVFENDTQTYTTGINRTINVEGDCHGVIANQSVQVLDITFFPEGTSALFAKEWVLHIVFGTSTNESFKIIDYSLSTQKTTKIPKFGHFVRDETNAGDVTATGVNAYKCSSSKLGLVGGGSIDLNGANVIAFANLNGTDFPTNQLYEVCFLDARTSDVVPIVVGACLAALVIVVLVAYLIGRARARRQGYASV